MTDEELKIQISLGLISFDDITPTIIWGLKDPELLDNLARIFYEKNMQYLRETLEQKSSNLWYNPYFPLQQEYDRIHEEFLNNPNTSTKTRIYINAVVIEIRNIVKEFYD